MKIKSLKIYLVVFILIVVLLPNFASAQLTNPLENSVPVKDSVVRDRLAPVDPDGGVVSSALGAIGSAIGVDVKKLNEVMKKVREGLCFSSKASAILSGANNVKGWTFGGMSLISGDPWEAATLQAQIITLSEVKQCLEGQLSDVKDSSITSIPQGQLRQSAIDDLTKKIQTVELKLTSLNAQYRNAIRGFWKTLVFNFLIKTSKAVADALVTKLVSNYKITNIKAYADSLATLMYDNQFLRDNFPGKQQQLMARAILENPQFRYKIHPGIFVAADQALGYDPKSLDVNDPNFYSKMALAGSGLANPYFQNSVYVGGVNQSRSNALAYAQTHILQSNGYKTPVNCVGALSEQKSIDARAKTSYDFLDDRRNLLSGLQSAKSLGQKVSDRDLAEAQADYDKALDQWNKLPYTVSGANSASQLAVAGGNNTEGDLAIKMCEAIVSPTTLINKGIDKAFDAIGAKMEQYNDNNLPSFISLIGNAASQISSSFIFGGSGAAKNAALINEGRLVNGAVQAANEVAFAASSANLAKGIEFDTPEKDPNNPNGYILNWNVLSAADPQVSDASFVTISGQGISATKTDPNTKATVPNKLPLSGSYAVTLTPVKDSSGTSFITSYPYILTVFDSAGKALTSATVSITYTPPTALNTDPNGPQVAGAYTQQPIVLTRGSKEQMFIR